MQIILIFYVELKNKRIKECFDKESRMMDRKSLNYFMLNVLSASLLFIFSGCSQEEPPQVKKDDSELKRQKAERLHINDPNFKTFTDAIVAADLIDIFEGTGPFTAFVPTNEAFEKLGKEKVKELFNPENKDQLTTILIYHIVPGKYPSRNLKSMNLKTVNGKNISVKVENGEIQVNNAKVLRKDIVGPNGVIHEIDTVLLP